MANELMEFSVTKQDISDANHILSTTGVCYPVSLDGTQKLPVTEEVLEGVNAQRKRLQTRNLQVHRQSQDWGQKPGNQGGNVISGVQTILEEGNYHIGCLQKKWETRTTYVRDQQRMLSPQNMTWLYYYILKEPGEGYKISSMYTQRIREYYGRGEEYKDGAGKYFRIAINVILVLCWLMFLIFLLILGVLIMTLAKNIATFMDLLGLLMLLFPFVVGIVVTIWLKKKCKLWKTWRMCSRKITGRIHERVPEFCLEKFTGILNNRLLRLIYADGAEDVGDLISCDIAGFLRDHADVVNCEFQNFWFTDFREEKDYMYLDVAYKVFLERDLGDRIGLSKETITLQLARPLHGIMAADFYHDWSVVKVETHEK